MITSSVLKVYEGKNISAMYKCPSRLEGDSGFNADAPLDILKSPCLVRNILSILGKKYSKSVVTSELNSTTSQSAFRASP